MLGDVLVEPSELAVVVGELVEPSELVGGCWSGAGGTIRGGVVMVGVQTYQEREQLKKIISHGQCTSGRVLVEPSEVAVVVVGVLRCAIRGVGCYDWGVDGALASQQMTGLNLV